MKTYLPLLLVIFLLAGCDKLKEQTFEATLIKNFTIDIDENSGSDSFNLEEEINALTNGGIDAVKESIVRYNVRKVSYKIWEYAGPESAIVNGTISLRSGSGSQLYNYSIDNESLQALNDSTEHIEFPFTQEQKDQIASSFLSGNTIRVQTEGQVSEVPVHFVLQVVADISATAEVE